MHNCSSYMTFSLFLSKFRAYDITLPDLRIGEFPVLFVQTQDLKST